MSAFGASVPPLVRLLAEPVRWRLMRELAAGDLRVRELAAAVGQPQNLVSYHLRQLRRGVVLTLLSAAGLGVVIALTAGSV